MTIQLTAPILIAGVHKAAGASLTLGADMEAELVNRGVAVFTVSPTTPQQGLVPALFDRTFTKLVKPDGVELSLGSASKFVRADAVAVACTSGVSTPQGLSANSLLDTHSLVDTVNGTILIPSDCTHFSAGLGSTLTWSSTAGTYRDVVLEVEVIAGLWVPVATISTASGLGAAPRAGAIVELLPASSNAGKKMRFAAKQDSGGTVTPGNTSFYAQFMTLP